MKAKNRLTTLGFACALGMLLMPAAGSGQVDLFKPSDTAGLADSQSEYLEALRQEPTTKSLRVVEIDLAIPASADALNFNLLPDLEVPLSTTEVVTRETDDYTWFGDDPATGAHAILVVTGEDMVGTVRSKGEVFLVRSLGGGAHAIVDVDETAFPPDHPPAFDDLDVGAFDASAAMADAVCKEITVVVGYTAKAKAEEPNIIGLIQLAIDETNQAYKQSKIIPRLKLVHRFGTQYTETDWNTDLSRFRTKGDGHIDEVHGYRDDYGADLAVLIRKKGGYCGLAYVMANESTAFSMVAHNCATGYYSFAHEIGHNQGCLHNPEVSPGTNPFAYGHGYRYDAGPWRTIMSYNCPSHCPRLKYFSNPDVKYGGVPMGTAATHNNARVINETACTMAGFRKDAFKLTLSPESIYFKKKGMSSALVATVTAGGAPLPGVLVNFQSSDPGVAAAPGSVTTNAQGKATVQVTGLKKGETTIEGSASGAMDTAVVKVPTVSPWGLLLLVGLGPLLLKKRGRSTDV